MSGFQKRHDGVIKLPKRLSYSSLSTYSECGEKWRLTRGLKLGENFTYWATLGGSAVHELINLHCREVLGEEVEHPTFEELFAKEEAEAHEAGEAIRASGTKLVNRSFKGGPNKKDRDWWLHYGPKMVEAFKTWLEETSWQLIATEHEFEVVIAGEPRIGAIDLVLMSPDEQFAIVDAKCGVEPPGKLQLGTYRAALREDLGIDAGWGYYLTFYVETEEIEVSVVDDEGVEVRYVRGEKKGQVKTETIKTEGPVKAWLSGEVNFGTYSDRFVESQYETLRRGLEQAVFIPNTRNNCGTQNKPVCPVFDFCRAVDGKSSLMVPIESSVIYVTEEVQVSPIGEGE